MRSIDWYVGVMEGIFSSDCTDEDLRRAIVREYLEELVAEAKKAPKE